MKRIGKHFLILILITIAVLIGILQWLKWYTHHGEQLVLPDYIDKPLLQAKNDATDRNFEIVVTDSVFLVGRAGGIIYDQNPKPGSQVKRSRKIYAIITKSDADMIKVRNLPRLYGERFSIKEKELIKGFEVKSNVVEYVYDAGLPDMIMEVKYKGKTIVDREGRQDDFEIPKGGTLDFILSKKSGGSFAIPNLVCQTYEEAKFILDNSLLTLGERSTDGSDIVDLSAAYVYKQEPAYTTDGQIAQGEIVNLYLTAQQPENCN